MNENKSQAVAIPESHLDLLTSGYAAIMTTVRHTDGLLSSNPVTAYWIDDTIKVSTLKSRIKYRNIIADPRVTICIVSPEDRMHYIEIRGHASTEDDPNREFHDAMFKKMTGIEPPEDMDPPDAERVTITLYPEKISCPQLYGGRFDKR